MPPRRLVAEARLAEAPGAEAVVFRDAERLDAFEAGGVRADLYLRLAGRDARPELGVDASRLNGVLLAGAAGPADIERLGARLAVAEAEHGLEEGSLRILALVDTPGGVLSLPALRPLPRLSGIACDPAALAAALRCHVDAPAIVQARAATVLAAAVCGVSAILVVGGEQTEMAAGEGFAAILLDDAPPPVRA